MYSFSEFVSVIAILVVASILIAITKDLLHQRAKRVRVRKAESNARCAESRARNA